MNEDRWLGSVPGGWLVLAFPSSIDCGGQGVVLFLCDSLHTLFLFWCRWGGRMINGWWQDLFLLGGSVECMLLMAGL
jgi:hypothetical protein